ncbi:TonB-dependent receptor [Litoribaculum gwangyangense]|uniref:TonB-dependent receptor n=1 Tax=Litoribaculum gwangyangense TaxID=1130722 RepID=A0ABP9CUZ2_9FLAO
MRTFIFLCFTVAFSITPNNVLSQNAKISIQNDQYLSVDEVFDLIMQQTDYKFIYQEGIFNDYPKIEVKKGIIRANDLLAKSLSNGNFTVSVGTDNTVIVKRKKEILELQPFIVNGIVSDQTGQPLPGANILEKGTSNGSQTDFDGKFSLEVSSENAILVVSYLGFLTQEIPVNGQNAMSINLVEDAADLDEIIVIGYGTAKKSDLTGAVTRLDATKYENQSATNIVELLNGTVAGFNSTQGATAAGGGSLEIRGANSLTASTEPLIVLDGVIYRGSLLDINPNDVASVDVLKDASSVAVYGAQGANGVVIITTKKGTDKIKVNLAFETGISDIANHVRPFNAQEYLNFRRDHSIQVDPGAPEAFYQNPNNLPSGLTLDQWRNYNNNPNADDTLEWLNRLNFFDEEIDNYINGRTTNWYDKVTQTGIRQSADVNVSGKTDNTSFFLSFGYTDNEGVIVGDEFKAYRTRVNLETEINDWFSFGVNAQFSSRDFSAVPAEFDFTNGNRSVFRVSPYGTDIDQNGDFVLIPHGYALSQNPLADHYAKQEEDIRNGLFGVLYANIKLPYGFNFKISYQNRFDFDKNYEFFPSSTRIQGLGLGSRTDFYQHEWMVDNILSWNKEFGDHAFDATFLWNVEELSSTRSFQEASDFAPNENLGFNGLQLGNPEFLVVDNNDLTRRGDALMARVNYRYMDKYLLTASVRRDGFSAFGERNPRATFPAAALGWVISKESFFPKGDFVNNLKLRFSWGENGNRSIGTYAALARLNSNQYLTLNGVAQGVIFGGTLANPNLRWEQTEAFNLGLDFGLLKNRINGTVEVYKANTTDLLVNRGLPAISGFTDVNTNIGEVENKGIEISINSINVNKPNFRWNSGVVFSLNRNKIIDLFGDTETVTINGQEVTRPVSDIQNGWFVGQDIDVIWGYKITGVWQQGQEADAALFGQVPGDYKAEDVNGDEQFTQLEDKQFIGYTTPRWRLGIRNDFTFLKNFTLSTFLRGEFGHKGRLNQLTHARTAIYDRINTYNLPYWSAENPSNEYGSLLQNDQAFETGLDVYRNRSYLRVQDVSLSYTFPKKLLDKTKFDSASIYASVRNLYTFTDWEGLDPESDSTPLPRIFSFGFRFSL